MRFHNPLAIFSLAAAGAAVAAQPTMDRHLPPALPKATRPAPAASPPGPNLPAMAPQQLVDRFLAARGGAAWKSVNALTFKGKMGAGASTYETVSKKLTLERKEREEMQLPFVLEAKRPNKTRWELTFNGQVAVQVFDGAAGYKYRPYLNRSDWEPYNPSELKLAQAEPGIDGWFASAVAAGARVESDGTAKVGDRDCYRLKVTPKGGAARRVWIDSKSYLEAREDGEPRMLDGRPHAVTVTLSDYRAEGGLQIAHTIETAVDGVPKPEKMAIDSVAVNPPLADSHFTRPR